MLLRELSWGGVYFSPLLFFMLISLILAGTLRMVLHKTSLGRLVWQEAWFDVALYICILALVTFLLGKME